MDDETITKTSSIIHCYRLYKKTYWNWYENEVVEKIKGVVSRDKVKLVKLQLLNGVRCGVVDVSRKAARSSFA